jgi:hypothetical protein
VRRLAEIMDAMQDIVKRNHLEIETDGHPVALVNIDSTPHVSRCPASVVVTRVWQT